jgi:RNA polymerase sigma-70 factor (ECF subfamily)
VARVRAALDLLPAEQREVVKRRIHDKQKFVEIAAELQVPLGTVLTRMRAALAKLKGLLGAENEI